VTVDALADAIAEEAGVVAFVEVVEAVDFDRSLADLPRHLYYCPYPIDQTVHPNHSQIADCLDLCCFPKSLGVIVGVVGSVAAIVVATAVVHRLVLKGLVETEDSLRLSLRHFARSDWSTLNCQIRYRIRVKLPAIPLANPAVLIVDHRSHPIVEFHS